MQARQEAERQTARGRPARAVPRPAAGWALALLIALAGCGGGDRGSVGSAAEVPLYRLSTLVALDPGLRERGVGVAFSLEAASLVADTLLVREAPQDDAPVLARLIRSFGSDYVLDAASPAAQGGGIEFGYEAVGLPLLEVAPGRDAPEWLHVHYATGPRGDPLTGWVRFEPDHVDVLFWSDRLRQVPLFFAYEDSIAFHSAPDGPAVTLRLAPLEGTELFDYIMYPLEVDGPWMRVEVVTPSNYCFDPVAPRRDTAWVRYLDEGERPRVWYYTRGC